MRGDKPAATGTSRAADKVTSHACAHRFEVGPHPQEPYAQLRALRAKKRALVARSQEDFQRAEAWVQRWGSLLRGFHAQ